MKPLKKTVLILSAIVITMALVVWIATVIFDLGWRRHPPLQEQLHEGKWIVRQLEQFREKHGRYPEESEAHRIVPGKLMSFIDPTKPRTDQPLYEPSGRPNQDRWHYSPDEPHFILYRFTGKTGERLYYSDLPFKYTDGVPRWYLQVEGGPPHILPSDSIK